MVLLLFATLESIAEPSVTADVPLDFGLLAVKSNASLSTLRIHTSGAVSPSGDLISMGGALRGEYQLAGFPAGVLLEFTWGDATLQPNGSGPPEHLTVTNYENATVISDELGEAVVFVGASLQTSGNSNLYIDAPFSGTAQLQVRYWSEEVENYLTHFDSVNITAALQTTITLIEDQAFSFGSIVAYADPLLTASMVLGANGSISTVDAGNARITSLGGAQVGVIRVTGAAKSVAVTITPEVDTISLTHAIPGAAQFFVKNFVTEPPSGSANTDASGELQISLGATLETDATALIYENGVYSGTYSLVVTY